MTMSMSVTLSVFVMVVVAAAVLGSTPLEDKDLYCGRNAYNECCRHGMRNCMERCATDADSCWDHCYYTAATNCGCHPSNGCCAKFLERYSSCLFHHGNQLSECWKQTQDVPC
uniref:Conotoxin n=1 Tax=Conus betulinus TaxID=89764 RepID=A0A142C1D7_CONBE|nr:conotoxin [Conus betulinus]